MKYTVLSDEMFVTVHRSIRDVICASYPGIGGMKLSFKQSQNVPVTNKEIERALRKTSLVLNLYELGATDWAFKIQKHRK